MDDVELKDTVAAADSSVTGDYNKKATNTATANGREDDKEQIASGVATLTEDSFANGNIIKVGEKEYTVTTDASKTGDVIYVGDLDWSKEDDALKTAVDRLTVNADNNGVWTLGQGATAGEVTFVEKVDADGKSYTVQKLTDGNLNEGALDLSDEQVIKDSFGVVTGKVEAKDSKAGNPLMLQIGDTSDSYNQLEVKVGDMHVDAMGIDKIDISKQDIAADAIQVIRDAINYVSGVRSNLGAVQSRLEHTGNNLSVMAENIQDAESAIRDTDVANKMMAYVKNNILVQSAQAMLTQANQVPQGVLQLLG